MNSKITFPATNSRGELVIRKIESIRIESGWKRLTDTAVITMPRKVVYFENNRQKLSFKKVKETFKKGDPVIIELGYNGNYTREFIGYIVHASADIPITIKCEDEMYQLKKIPVHTSLQKTSLKELLHKIIPNYNIDALEIEIGAQRFVKTTVAKVLEYLKDEYSLYSYMKGKELVCGKIYADDSSEPIKINLEKNIVNNDLSYKSKEDLLIKINAVSTLSDGQKIEVVVGDDTGEERQLAYYGISLKSELLKIAHEDLKKYKVDGFTGSIKCFGVPVINHGDKIDLESQLYPDRNGVYYVENTTVDFDNSSGYKRKVQLGDKVKA